MRTTTTTGGSSASTAVAITRCHSTAASVPIILTIPMTIVSSDGSVATSSGQRYWFQPYTNRITNSAATLAADTGSRMSFRNRHGPAPSMRAASTSSSGTAMNTWRKSSVAVADAISGIVNPVNVLISPSPAITEYVGMIRTSTGSISVMKMVQNARLRNGKRKNATA